METDKENKFDPILKIAEWVSLKTDDPIDEEIFTDARMLVASSMIDRDYEALDELVNQLTPLAAKSCRRFQAEKIPLWILQAAEIPVLSTIVRASLYHLENVDHDAVLEHIRYGKEVLKILLNNILDKGLNRKYALPLNLSVIKTEMSKNSLDISEATISRCLKALEDTDFIHLFGSTRSRKCHVLTKAWEWFDSNVKPETEKNITEQGHLKFLPTQYPQHDYSGGLYIPENNSEFVAVQNEKNINMQKRKVGREQDFLNGIGNTAALN